MSPRTLILDSGNSSSYHLLRTLSRAGYEAHLSTSEDTFATLWGHSRYCARVHRSPPASDAPRFLQFLVDLLSATRYELLFICGDDEAEVVWNHRDSIENRVHCFLPGQDAREIAFSKNAAYRHAAHAGVAVPHTQIPSSQADLHGIAQRVGMPAVVKGERGVAAARVKYAHSVEELEQAYARLADVERAEGGRPSVQEYVHGQGYVVHALFRDGEPMAICSHRKEREYPVTGGVTSRGTTVHHPELDNAALAFLGSLRWHGLAKLDFKLDAATKRFVFMELDPRVSASFDITRAAGADQALMLCNLAAGNRVEPQLDYREGVRYRWLFPRDVLAVLAKPTDLPSFIADFLVPGVHRDLELWDDPRVFLGAMRVLQWYVRRDLRRRRRAVNR